MKDAVGRWTIDNRLGNLHKLEAAMQACAQQDGGWTTVAFMRDPGSVR